MSEQEKAIEYVRCCICTKTAVEKEYAEGRSWRQEIVNGEETWICPECRRDKTGDWTGYVLTGTRTSSATPTQDIQGTTTVPLSSIPAAPAHTYSVPQPKAVNRLAVVDMLYYQSSMQQPVVKENRFSRLIKSDEQPYSRTMKVGEEWVALDWGWLTEVGMLMLVNEEGLNLQTNPSMDYQLELDSKIVELGLVVRSNRDMHAPDDPSGPEYLSKATVMPYGQIPPRESARLQPTNLARQAVRCRKGEVKLSIIVLPL